MNPFGTEFWKFSRKGSFFQKNAKKIVFQRLATSGRHNSAVITERQKFVTKITLYGMSSFHFYRWNQFIVIPVACTLRTRNLPQKFLRYRTRHHSMLQCHNDYDEGISGRGLMTSLREGKDRSFNKITANWVVTEFALFYWMTIFSFSSSRYCADRSIVGHWYVSNAAMTLATVSTTSIPVLFMTVRAGMAYRHLF